MRDSESSGAAKGMLAGVLAVLAVVGTSVARFGDDLGHLAATGARSASELSGASTALRSADELGVAGTLLDDAAVGSRLGAGDDGLHLVEHLPEATLEAAAQAAELLPAGEDAPAEPIAGLASWVRMSSADFGCLMERSWQHKDALYNCSTGEVDPGDPCKDTEPYYAGPALPLPVAQRIHPAIEDLSLEWEHADLRLLRVTLDRELPEVSARALLGLPAPGEALPSNLQSITVEEKRGRTIVALVGFDHMGSGDVDCP